LDGGWLPSVLERGETLGGETLGIHLSFSVLPIPRLFALALSVLEGDSSSSIARRLARIERGIKDFKKVKLYRYEDPGMGPRNMPNPDEILA
jgi:hypothetical protein